jgi:hypothetical protein
MTKATGIPILAVLLAALGACASTQQQLDNQQATAVSTALARGRFELACPEATAVVLSRDFIQPAIQGPWVQGLQRLEYTVGVEGCGQRTTVITICQEGSDTCFAANPDNRFIER